MSQLKFTVYNKFLLFSTVFLFLTSHYLSLIFFDFYRHWNFTLMLPCIVIDFFLNNQPDALIIQIYSIIKLYMFRVSSLPIIRSFLLYIQHC